jgi:hypothetical protein
VLVLVLVLVVLVVCVLATVFAVSLLLCSRLRNLDIGKLFEKCSRRIQFPENSIHSFVQEVHFVTLRKRRLWRERGGKKRERTVGIEVKCLSPARWGSLVGFSMGCLVRLSRGLGHLSHPTSISSLSCDVWGAGWSGKWGEGRESIYVCGVGGPFAGWGRVACR